MSSIEPHRYEFAEAERNALLFIACQSIEAGLRTGRPAVVSADGYSSNLAIARASFVTLLVQRKLRGCIGTLEARTSLAEDVSHNAYAAAFNDTRFPPLSADELTTLTVQISVLSVPERMDFDSEATLLAQLTTGIDGLILQEQSHRGTFLPSVWESLPQPDQFLRHLKLKAGLADDYWSDTIAAWRYTTESFAAEVPAIKKNARDQRLYMLK